MEVSDRPLATAQNAPADAGTANSRVSMKVALAPSALKKHAGMASSHNRATDATALDALPNLVAGTYQETLPLVNVTGVLSISAGTAHHLSSCTVGAQSAQSVGMVYQLMTNVDAHHVRRRSAGTAHHSNKKIVVNAQTVQMHLLAGMVASETLSLVVNAHPSQWSALKTHALVVSPGTHLTARALRSTNAVLLAHAVKATPSTRRRVSAKVMRL